MSKSTKNKQNKKLEQQSNNRRARTTNRRPAKITQEVDGTKILASNIDTLVLSFDIFWDEAWYQGFNSHPFSGIFFQPISGGQPATHLVSSI
nr:hypothetical protein [uncultured Desulfobacter sp.]